jgi:hypothetical protein
MTYNKWFFMFVAVLLALTSCTNEDNPAPEPTPAGAVLGEWFTQVNANGVLDEVSYDAYAILVMFQDDGHGLLTQYFLKDGQLVSALGSMTDYTVDSHGNISIVISEVGVPLGKNVRMVDGKLMLDMPDHDLHGLTLTRPTDVQQQVIKAWDLIVEEWGGKGGDGDTAITEVTTDGANGPGRARQR